MPLDALSLDGICDRCMDQCVERSQNVATQMARDHARLTPDVDTPILYYIIARRELTNISFVGFIA